MHIKSGLSDGSIELMLVPLQLYHLQITKIKNCEKRCVLIELFLSESIKSSMQISTILWIHNYSHYKFHNLLICVIVSGLVKNGESHKSLISRKCQLLTITQINKL